MTSLDYAAKCGELDGLLKRYRTQKQHQTASLQRQLEEEVTTNAELRHHIAFLEAKLQTEREGASQRSRLQEEKERTSMTTLARRERDLHATAEELEERLRAVQQREQGCTEFAAHLDERERQHRAAVNAFQTNKSLFEAGLEASKKTVRALLQVSAGVALPITALTGGMRDKDSSPLVHESSHAAVAAALVVRFCRDESASRASILLAESEQRCSLVAAFARTAMEHTKQALLERRELDIQLRCAEDLLQLQHVECAGRLRKAADLRRDSRSEEELRRKELVLQRKRVLRIVGNVIDALPGIDAGAVLLDLEGRLQSVMPEQPSHGQGAEPQPHYPAQ
ncbi:hypothetical protein NESM_000781700 [Novymonas esmeraldas]|uniref:Uncharacterized protein n=1 Tax=Novymonas esmeraldas TaxID=1808958 RepID=A0AAW0EXP8_9TRYP